VTNHLGGCGIIGLLACLAAIIVKRKRRNHRKAFLFSLLLPIGLGVAVVLVVLAQSGIVYCGGGIVLAVALLTVISTVFLTKRKDT